MPFTPLHLGPGATFKAIGGRHFSFMVFGGSQVLMDIEPLIGILTGKPILHGYTHTIVGALIIGMVAALIGKPISAYALTLLRIPHYSFTWLAAFSGALVGTFSHILFDAVMHSDMRPWWPFSNTNGLLHIVSIENLHLACVALGAGYARNFRKGLATGQGLTMHSSRSRFAAWLILALGCRRRLCRSSKLSTSQ